MNLKTGVAIAGTGFMGWVHTEALRRIPDVEVVGVCGSSPTKAAEFAKQYAIERAYRDYQELLADDSVDAVHIGTPNRLHFEMAKQAILAGKHVMCEKPLAMNSQQSSELVELAKAHDHLCTAVNYNIRFYPLCLQARECVRGTELGTVVHVTGGYVQDWLTRPTDYNWRVLAAENGPLRAVADIGTHWLDLIHSLTGLEVESLCADLMTVHPVRQRPLGEVETFTGTGKPSGSTEPIDIETEDYGSVLLRFVGGARGNLNVSQVTPGRKNCLRFEIAGSQQSIAWNSEQPNELWIGNRDQPNRTLLRDPALLTAAAAEFSTYPGGHNEGYADSFKQCFRAFYQSIKAGPADRCQTLATFADGHREIEICEAILESHKQQAWVNL